VERNAWLCGVGISRAAVMSALREEFDALTQRQREELFTAKAALLASPRAADLEVRLDVLLRDFVEAARRFVADNRERIDGAGLDAAAVVADVDAWTQAWRHTRDLSVGHSAAPGRGFLVPGDASAEPEQELAGEAARPGRKHNREALVVSTASLRILEMPRPPGLRLLGEVDAGSVDALGSALSGVIAGGGDRHLDLSGVLFCDLGGLRVVVDAAQRLGSGRRLVVHGMPAHMRRAMSVAGWDSLPSLVLAEALSA
jgi:anti-anti-sigma regulatory factor